MCNLCQAPVKGVGYYAEQVSICTRTRITTVYSDKSKSVTVDLVMNFCRRAGLRLFSCTCKFRSEAFGDAREVDSVIGLSGLGTGGPQHALGE